MLQEVIYCITEGSQVVFNHIPHHIIIDVEIAMCDMVAHAFYSLPWNFGLQLQVVDRLADLLQRILDDSKLL